MYSDPIPARDAHALRRGRPPLREPRMTRLVVFDFDGVIADSEVLANTVLAEFVTELGAPLSLEDALRTYMGKRMSDVLAAVAAATGRPLPDDAGAELGRRTLARFRSGLREVTGFRSYLASIGHLSRCIASSSSPERLAACLDVLRLRDAFGTHVYSASLVPRGKPHPDLFLHVARQFGIDPAEAIVIEDSEGGVRGAVAAGMTVIGLLAASHIGPGDEARLRRAGAHHVARTYDEVADVTRALAG
jgi:beta-phosphoglucomutase-like phosphatase (HAD superfamily)